MDQKTCAVVQDLLVLYEDNVLREESKQVVEEHISSCDECRSIYECSCKEMPEIERIKEKSQKEQEEEAVRVMKRAASRIPTLKQMCVIASILIVLVLFEIIFGWVTDTEGVIDYLSEMPAKSIKVEELYRLNNGDIYCTLSSEEKLGYDSFTESFDIRKSEGDKEHVYIKDISFKRSLTTKTPYCQTADFVFETKKTEISEENGGEKGKENVYYCQTIQMIGKNSEDKLTIWKEGQDVENASIEVEKKVIKEYLRDGRLKKASSACEALGLNMDVLIEEMENENTIKREYWEKRGYGAEGPILFNTTDSLVMYDFAK